MDIQIQTDASKIKITITDRGEGFDLTKLRDPDIERFIKESKHGGLGIYLIKTLMDEVDYDFKPGVKNQVQLTKYIQKPVAS
jgi:anti-sigma regulatory factor (Ser/Thr protein kinase)